VSLNLAETSIAKSRLSVPHGAVIFCDCVQGMEVIFRVGIAILLLNLDELRCLDMEETIQVDFLLFSLLTF